MKKGIITRKEFLEEAGRYIADNFEVSKQEQEELLKVFEQYIFGYSRISPLIDDETVSDIRIVSHDNVRVKRRGKRMDG